MKFITAILGIPIIAAMLQLWIVGFSYLPWKFVYWTEISQGEKIVSKIEDFRKHHRRLPNPDNTEEMTDLGFELVIGYRPEYRPMGDNVYEISYYMGFDGPRIIYSSKEKQWYCEGCEAVGRQ